MASPGRGDFLVVGLAMVKNEEDIVEPFIRHNLDFLDALFVADNGSTDATRAILADLQHEGVSIVVFDDAVPAYVQAEKMTRYLRGISSTVFPDFVVPLDADEFIRCDSREAFRAQLDRIPAGGVGFVPWMSYVVTPAEAPKDLADPPRSITHRRRTEWPAVDKAIVRLDGRPSSSVTYRQGNHGARGSDGGPLPSIRLEGVSLAHFPVRSAEQLTAKAVVGWMAYLAKDRNARQSRCGYQWQEAFDTVVAHGGMPQSEVPEHSMRYAQRQRVIDWAEDAVLDPMPFNYDRRYGAGKREPALATIAKSWERTLAPPESFATSLAAVVEEKMAVAGISGVDHRKVSDSTFHLDWHLKHPFVDLAPYRYLAERFRPASVLDVGCGLGAPLLFLRSMGVSMIKGIDGHPVRDSVLPECCYVQHDLSKPFAPVGLFDIVMCVEVVEHLDASSEDVLLASLAAHAKDVILFSAGDSGQPGLGHVNCRPAAYWTARWRELGWEPDALASLAFRSLATLSWLRRNPLVLRRIAAGRRQPDPFRHRLEHIGNLRYRWHGQQPKMYDFAFTEDPPADAYPDFLTPKDAFLASSRVLFRLAQWVGKTRSFHPLHDLDLRGLDSGVLAVAKGSDPYFHLPEFVVPPDAQVVIHMRLDSSIDTELQVYFQTSEKPKYREESSVSSRIGRGANDLYISLPVRGVRGRIRIDPSRAPGELMFTTIDVKAFGTTSSP